MQKDKYIEPSCLLLIKKDFLYQLHSLIFVMTCVENLAEKPKQAKKNGKAEISNDFILWKNKK